MTSGVHVLEQPTLVLNRHWVPVHLTTARHALTLLYQQVARAVHPSDGSLHRFQTWADLRPVEGQAVVHTVNLALAIPDVIVLERYGKVPRRTVPFNRRNLYTRDQHRCQYCRRTLDAPELTIDHVLPRVQGGVSSWTNCVLACVDCNRRKAHRTPEQAHMRLMKKPVQPSWTPRHLFHGMPRRASWEKIVGHAYWNVNLDR
ncbi:MAG: restriction endonuclease [Gemmatimonadota bacterium]|nr:MAG: restriction endonuclease [Gemmatimonadota bacterium]